MEKKTLGAFIATLRKERGMTQKELAEQLHVSDKAVSRWERDESAPDLSAVPVIADIFGITCDELLRGRRSEPLAKEAASALTQEKKTRLTKKGKITLLTAVALCIVVWLVLFQVPFYPNRYIYTDTYTQMQEKLTKKGLFAPTENTLYFQPTEYQVLWEDSTLLSPCIGGHARGQIKYKGVVIEAIFLTSRRDQLKPYEPIKCIHGSTYSFRHTEVLFSHGDQYFDLYCSYSEGNATEINAYLEEIMMDSAYQILKQAGLKSGDYPVLPESMTEWTVETEYGGTISGAAVPRGEKMYKLSLEEYRSILDGADPDEVLADRWRWWQGSAVVAPNEELPVRGTVETFTCGDLVMEISNVKEIRTELHEEYDGVDFEHREVVASWEYDVYVVYPGAKATVINPGYATEGPPGEEQTYIDWFFFTTIGERIPIEEGMDQVPITEKISGIVDEGYTPLWFEIYGGE